MAHRVAQGGADDRLNVWIVTRAAARHSCSLTLSDTHIEVTRGREVVKLARRDLVHVPHVARDFDVFFCAVDPERKGESLVVDYSEVREHHYRPLKLDLLIPSMQEAIDVEQVYCPYSQPRAGDLVYDLGANIGVVSIWLARFVGPTGRVIAFEPDPRNLECLKKNIDSSGLSNVTIVEAAVGGSSGTASFFSEGSIGSAFQNTRAESMVPSTLGEEIQVPTISLANAFNKFGVPGWIKIDIEGAELEVLQSSLDLLRESKPGLAIETDHVRGGETTAARVEEMLRSIGFDVITGRVGGTQMTWTKAS